MLNAELKSMNSNLTYVSVLSICVGWVEGSGDGIIGRAIGPICKLEGSREWGRTDLMCCMTSRSKHFMRIGVSAYWTVVIEAGWR